MWLRVPCLVLVASRNGFERNFTFEIKLIVEDVLKWQINPFIKYPHLKVSSMHCKFLNRSSFCFQFPFYSSNLAFVRDGDWCSVNPSTSKPRPYVCVLITVIWPIDLHVIVSRFNVTNNTRKLLFTAGVMVFLLKHNCYYFKHDFDSHLERK